MRRDRGRINCAQSHEPGFALVWKNGTIVHRSVRINIFTVWIGDEYAMWVCDVYHLSKSSCPREGCLWQHTGSSGVIPLGCNCQLQDRCTAGDETSQKPVCQELVTGEALLRVADYASK